MTSQLENALAALRRGFRVFPCQPRAKQPHGVLAPHGVKDATDDEAQIHRWWKACPDANPGITGGVIVDCDTGLNNKEDAEKFARLNGLPPTFTVRTGRRNSYGVQFHFTGGSDNFKFEANGVFGEVRCRNEYGMAPGAVHPVSGERYEVIVDLPPALFPAGALAQDRKAVSKPTAGEKITKDRNIWLTSQAGRLVNAGMAGKPLLAALHALNLEHCDPPLPAGEVQNLHESAGRNFEPTGPVAELRKVDAWLNDENAAIPPLEDAVASLAICDPLAVDQRRKKLASRLGVSVPALKKEIAKKKRSSTQDNTGTKTDLDVTTATVAEVREKVEGLLDVRPDEADKKQAENLIWNFLRARSQVFCCGGVGYLLLRNRDGVLIDGVPIAVTRDGQDFNRLLITLGVHPGSPTRDRIGKFIGTRCYHEGVLTETRLAFHYEPRAFTAYVARERGYIIKVTQRNLEEVPNGTDGQLFLFPDNWRPLLTRPLAELAQVIDPGSRPGRIPRPAGDLPPYYRLKRSLFPDGLLRKHLFGGGSPISSATASGTSFEIRSMNERQIHVLILAYLLFLMMPGVVSERVMLQTLGPSASGKSFLLEYIGHLLLGPKFKNRPMPEDIREFENQIINEYFIAYDNVSHVPREIKDRFCQAVTGVEVVRRELFTTAQEARYPSKATISLSAITPPLPELEHQNRTITINFQERAEGSFIAKEELIAVLDRNRDGIILSLLRRMMLALQALEAERAYVPKVNVRLASVATFILRIARHEGWVDHAQRLLDAWGEEQTGYAMQDDDVSTALTRWMALPGWKPNVELTATALNEQLCRVMNTEPGKGAHLNWGSNHLSLAKVIGRNLKIYASRFGLKRSPSKARNSRGGWAYVFNPTMEQLTEIKGGLTDKQPAEVPANPTAEVPANPVGFNPPNPTEVDPDDLPF